jgi:hypothetical protein
VKNRDWQDECIILVIRNYDSVAQWGRLSYIELEAQCRTPLTMGQWNMGHDEDMCFSYVLAQALIHIENTE